MNTISIVLNTNQINQLKSTFSDQLIKTEIPYVNYQIKTSDCVITVYDSKKVVFQGNDAEIYASSFMSTKDMEHAGSDEVGTGDYFGPVVVAGAIVRAEDYELLRKLGVDDSKKITDQKILEIAPTLMKTVCYTLLVVDNEKYNKIHPTTNLNAIKAKLHNKAYLNLAKKSQLPALCVVDQFASPINYFKYLANEPNVYRHLHFETKAESKYLAVAVASIIARYAFLKHWELMEEKWNFNFTKGASSKVDADIGTFVDQFGKKALCEVAKVHFKNTKVVC